MSQYGRRFSAPVRSAASQAASSAAASASSSSSSSAAPAAAAAFVHRDIFAHPAPDDITFQSPRKHGRRPSEQSFIPSKSKLERWNTKLGNYPLLGWLESHTGVRKLYIASFLLFLGMLLVFRGTGLSAVSVSVGFLYPLHMSLKTIENCTSLAEEISGENRHRHTEDEIIEKRGEIVGQLRQWLVYWVVYGLFNTLESLSDFSLSWLPIYHPLKLIFLLWCFLPQYQGSQLVFDILVRPVLIRHESAIENGVETAQQAAIFSVGRVGRVVRAKSIQLSNAIQLKMGSASESVGVSSSTTSKVRLRVAAIESMSSMGVSSTAATSLPGIVESHDEHLDGADHEGQSFEAFRAAGRLAAEQERKQ